MIGRGKMNTSKKWYFAYCLRLGASLHKPAKTTAGINTAAQARLLWTHGHTPAAGINKNPARGRGAREIGDSRLQERNTRTQYTPMSAQKQQEKK